MSEIADVIARLRAAVSNFNLTEDNLAIMHVLDGKQLAEDITGLCNAHESLSSMYPATVDFLFGDTFADLREKIRKGLIDMQGTKS